MRTFLAALAACTLVLGALPPAEANRDVSVAVLGLEVADAPDALAKEITDALRQRVAATRGFLPKPGKELIEMKLIYGCVDENPACMAQAGKSLGVDKLIYGNLKKGPRGLTVTLKYLDTASGRVENTLSEPLSPAQAQPGGVQGLVPAWFAQLSGAQLEAAMRIACNVLAAKVYVDGKLVGSTGSTILYVGHLAPGTINLRVAKEGFADFVQPIVLAPGADVRVDVQLAPSAGAAPAGATAGAVETAGPGDGRRGYKIGAWVTAGAAVALLGTALAFGLHVKSLEDQKRDQIRASQTDADPTNDIVGKGDACDEAKGKNAAVTSTCDDGKSAATLTNVFLAVGVASGAVAGYLFYKAYGGAPSERASARRRGLSLLPTFDGRSGGLVARLAF